MRRVYTRLLFVKFIESILACYLLKVDVWRSSFIVNILGSKTTFIIAAAWATPLAGS